MYVVLFKLKPSHFKLPVNVCEKTFGMDLDIDSLKRRELVPLLKAEKEPIYGKVSELKARLKNALAKKVCYFILKFSVF